MAPEPSRDRPWLLADSDEERLRLLDEAYRNDPVSLSSEDLYQLCDLADPFWDLVKSIRDAGQSKDNVADGPEEKDQSSHSDEPNDIPDHRDDETSDDHGDPSQALLEESGNTVDSETISVEIAPATEAADAEIQPTEHEMLDNMEEQISEATNDVYSNTRDVLSESLTETANTDANALATRAYGNSTKRARNEGAASGRDDREGPQAKVQRIQETIDMVATQAPDTQVEAVVPPNRCRSDETEDAHASSNGQVVLYVMEGRGSTVHSLMEASHEYIPALLLSAVILHLYTRNL